MAAAWWDGNGTTTTDEAPPRILIAPAAVTPPAGNGKGVMLSLCHPKSGNQTCYLLTDSGSLQELHWFKQSYGSWFLGDYVCEDGGLYIATPIDPVFLLFPIFDQARMKKEGDQGKFRQLDEILSVDGYPGYQRLISIAEDCMQIVCEMKEIGGLKFFRLNDSKVLAWLCYKVHQLKTTLPSLDKNYGAQGEKDLLFEVVSILGEYLKEDPWLKLLCSHFKLDLQHATRQAPSQEFVPYSGESTPSNQAKIGSSSKTSNGGKQGKKMKMETNSHNIKDMFRRATRSQK